MIEKNVQNNKHEWRREMRITIHDIINWVTFIKKRLSCMVVIHLYFFFQNIIFFFKLMKS